MANQTIFFLGLKVIALVLLAVWLYRDSRSRDYYWLMWTIAPVMMIFLGGVAWAPAAVLLVLVYIGIRPRGAIGPCPHCKKAVHEELAFCPFCRRSIKRECLKCHRTVPWDATICPHCHSAALTDS